MSLNVSAATNSGNYYLITTANSEWQNQSVAYRIYDSSLNTVKSGTANANGSGDVYLLPSAGNGVRLEFSVAPFTLPDKAVKNVTPVFSFTARAWYQRTVHTITQIRISIIIRAVRHLKQTQPGPASR